jgi:hypothetical protein
MYTIVDRYYMTMKERLGAGLFSAITIKNKKDPGNEVALGIAENRKKAVAAISFPEPAILGKERNLLPEARNPG